MAGLVKTIALVYFFCLAQPQYGIAWNVPSPPPSRCDSTAPFCGDSSSTTVLKCCDVVARGAPTDFQAAVKNSGASSCADLTCQLCSSAPSTGSASRLICAALLHNDNGAKGVSTTTNIVLIALLVGGIILLLGLIFFITHLKMIVSTVTNLILSNKSEQNINVNIDSEAKAVSNSNANAMAHAAAEASATSEANVEANLEQRWVLVDKQWKLLLGQFTVRNVPGACGTWPIERDGIPQLEHPLAYMLGPPVTSSQQRIPQVELPLTYILEPPVTSSQQTSSVNIEEI